MTAYHDIFNWIEYDSVYVYRVDTDTVYNKATPTLYVWFDLTNSDARPKENRIKRQKGLPKDGTVFQTKHQHLERIVQQRKKTKNDYFDGFNDIVTVVFPLSDT